MGQNRDGARRAASTRALFAITVAVVVVMATATSARWAAPSPDLTTQPWGRSADPEPGLTIDVTRLDDGLGCEEPAELAGCTLRGAVALAASHDVPVRIRIPAARLVRQTPRPIRVEGNVTITGVSPTSSVIDASGIGRTFTLVPGSALHLERLSVLGGDPTAASSPTETSLSLAEVYLGDGPSAFRAVRDVLVYCSTPTATLGQFYGDAEITDATAMRHLPGATL